MTITRLERLGIRIAANLEIILTFESAEKATDLYGYQVGGPEKRFFGV